MWPPGPLVLMVTIDLISCQTPSTFMQNLSSLLRFDKEHLINFTSVIDEGQFCYIYYS